ncbi:MAG: LysM peptidoglycan-binding domain-containing protein [bacterium]|nr:LysM peptidoglycan-binding domain-containing protein [bacterium]
MVSTIADRNDVTVGSVLRYNDHLHAENQKLGEGTYVYLQPLRGSFRGKKTWHVVQTNERMIDIALAYGVNLNKLYKRNDMSYGSEAAVGEKVKLKGGRTNSPRLRPRNIREEKPVTEGPVLITENETPPPQPTAVPVSQPVDKKPELAFPGWKPFEIEEEEEEEEYIDFDNWENDDTFREPIFTPGIKDDPKRIPPVIDSPGTPATDPATTVNTTPGPDNAKYHEVMKGDTLWNISRRYGVSVDRVKQLNNLTSNAINIGQRLRIG